MRISDWRSDVCSSDLSRPSVNAARRLSRSSTRFASAASAAAAGFGAMAPGFGGAGFAGTGMVCAEVVWAGDADDAAPDRGARSRRPVLTSCTHTETQMPTMLAKATTTADRREGKAEV